jgi:tol-pal system beta propeller repeat protein TolB
MQPKYNLAHFLLASVVFLVLTPLMVVVNAQAQITFSSNRDGNWEIYVMDAKGRNQRSLTNNRHHDTDPAWSPAGKHIAYVSTIDRNKEIYVMDADGGNQRRLTNSGDVHIHNWKPSWSPDGERIAFTSNRDGNLKIFVMNTDGGQQRNCTKDIHGDDSSWSPDGKRIAFVSERDGNKEIYVINADGRRAPRRLTKNLHDDADPAWYNPAFAVAPAGKKFTI